MSDPAVLLQVVLAVRAIRAYFADVNAGLPAVQSPMGHQSLVAAVGFEANVAFVDFI